MNIIKSKDSQKNLKNIILFIIFIFFTIIGCLIINLKKNKVIHYL